MAFTGPAYPSRKRARPIIEQRELYCVGGYLYLNECGWHSDLAWNCRTSGPPLAGASPPLVKAWRRFHHLSSRHPWPFSFPFFSSPAVYCKEPGFTMPEQRQQREEGEQGVRTVPSTCQTHCSDVFISSPLLDH